LLSPAKTVRNKFTVFLLKNYFDNGNDIGMNNMIVTLLNNSRTSS